MQCSHLEGEAGRLGNRSRVLTVDHVLGDVKLNRVQALLGLRPGRLTRSLLVSEHLVVCLELLELGGLARRHLVLKHASHAGRRLGLGGVLGGLVQASGAKRLLLGDLLAGPVLLQRSVAHLSGVEVQILTLELAAARDRLRQLLRRKVSSLGGTLHIII